MGKMKNSTTDKYRLIVAGSRDFSDWKLMLEKMDLIVEHLAPREVEIVSGGAEGADTMADDYANMNGLDFKEFLADWNDMSEPCVKRQRKDGKWYNALAGMKRNQKMADYGDGLVVFFGPRGETKGSKDMAARAAANNLPVKKYYEGANN